MGELLLETTDCANYQKDCCHGGQKHWGWMQRIHGKILNINEWKKPDYYGEIT